MTLRYTVQRPFGWSAVVDVWGERPCIPSFPVFDVKARSGDLEFLYRGASYFQTRGHECFELVFEPEPPPRAAGFIEIRSIGTDPRLSDADLRRASERRTYLSGPWRLQFVYSGRPREGCAGGVE